MIRALLERYPAANVEVGPLDLADLESVAAFAAARSGRLDLLVNNAGLMAIDESRTAQGVEMQFGVNHLGHFALTARLLPLLLATPGSRVGTMSSMGHRAARRGESQHPRPDPPPYLGAGDVLSRLQARHRDVCKSLGGR